MHDSQADVAEAAFAEAFGGSPSVVGTAPGRVNLVGGHTDYNDGFVLPAAIDRRTAVAGRVVLDEGGGTGGDEGDGTAGDGDGGGGGAGKRTLSVHAAAFDERHDADLDALGAEGAPDAPEWFRYVAGVVDALGVCDRGGEGGGGLELAVAGDVPLGAGLSSSASLELAVGVAVAELFELDVTDRELISYCWEAETGFVGVDCGIMDQYAVALGEPDAALFLDCRARTHEAVPIPPEARVVVVDTNVEHELAGSAYNDRVAECRAAAERFDALLDDEVTALRDVSVEAFETHAEELPRPARDRAEHVVRENERVREAAARLRDGDLDRCGELLYASHASLRELYEVSCDELNCVVELARGTDGVPGARMTGGGFGGSVVALVQPEAVESFAERVATEYPERTGVDPDVYVCEVGDGVRTIRPDPDGSQSRV